MKPVDADEQYVLVRCGDGAGIRQRATQRRRQLTLSVGEAMPHVFRSSLGSCLAAKQSVNAAGDFLRQRLIYCFSVNQHQLGRLK
ncbi:MULTISPECIES: hypothetical protein [Mesorhizobium]|uniref:hypothetical protein n=1 Tax=Mesorhizobium TaxID=68287 RepID=UPI001FE40509|nr:MULTISPECIES: hypothetical protein [Mesorhizobium]